MNRNLTVFLVEDDTDLQLGCVQALQLADIAVRAFDSVEAVLPHLSPGMAGVVVTDMRLPGADGLSLIAEAHDLDPDLPVIMITGHGDVNLAVQAMRSGCPPAPGRGARAAGRETAPARPPGPRRWPRARRWTCARSS